MARKRVILTSKGMIPRGPYSQGWIAGDLVVVAAHCSYDRETGRVIGTTLEEQFDHIIALVKPVLQEAGCGLQDVVRAGVFLKDMSYYDEYNRCFAKHFPGPAPARCTVGAGQLPENALIQMELLAIVPDAA